MGRTLTPATNLLFGSPVAVCLFTGCIEVDAPPPPEPGSCEPGVPLVLDPPAGPSHRIGACVEVTVGDHSNVLWMLRASASSSSAPELYPGLRGLEAAESIVVTWPDGSVSEEGDVQGGTVLVLP